MYLYMYIYIYIYIYIYMYATGNSGDRVIPDTYASRGGEAIAVPHFLFDLSPLDALIDSRDQ